jgi:flagellar biogenesis protein FliO
MIYSKRMKIRIFAFIVVGIVCAFAINVTVGQNGFSIDPGKSGQLPSQSPLTPRNSVKQERNSTRPQQVAQLTVRQRESSAEKRYVNVSPNKTTPISAPANSANDPLNKKLVPPKEKKQKPVSGFLNSKSGNSILKVIGGLSAVLAIFYAFTIFAKRNGAKVSSKLPADIIQVLGTMPIDAKRKFQLVRLGSKLLLLSVTEKSVETVSEITDPVEVEYFVSRLQTGKNAEAFNSMRQMMAQMRQQKRAQRMYPSQFPPDFEDESTGRRVTGANVFEA